MDLDDFRSILDTTDVDVWAFIDTAILVASLDYGAELKHRRDKIMERLYATSISNQCRNCGFGGRNTVEDEIVDVGVKEEKSDIREEKLSCTPRSVNEEDDVDPYGGLFDDDQKRILEIKEQLEDPKQSEDSLVDLLQSLADMDITFQALQETDIGRHVNRLRKHSSNDIKRLVKHLVRKWKDIVDEWVRLNPPGEHRSPELMVDEDSPPQKNPQNVRNKVPDFTYSPNPQNGSSGSEKNNSEPERKLNPKPKPVPPRREPPARPLPLAPTPIIQRQREQKDNVIDAERLASASKRLQENYKEAENAKRQRTIQVMDIHELPKPKSRNAFFPKNKGGGSQGRHR